MQNTLPRLIVIYLLLRPSSQLILCQISRFPSFVWGFGCGRWSDLCWWRPFHRWWLGSVWYGQVCILRTKALMWGFVAGDGPVVRWHFVRLPWSNRGVFHRGCAACYHPTCHHRLRSNWKLTHRGRYCWCDGSLKEMWRWYDGVWGGRHGRFDCVAVGWWLVVALEKKIRRRNTASKYGVKPPQKWEEISGRFHAVFRRRIFWWRGWRHVKKYGVEIRRKKLLTERL